jgi:hypothetical protein
MSRSYTKVSTLYNRMRRCPEFKERENYALLTENIILSALDIKTGPLNETSFLESFTKLFNSRAFTGKRNVVLDDREMFRDFVLKCVDNIIKVVPSMSRPPVSRPWKNLIPNKLMDIVINGKRHRLQLSGYNSEVTEEKLDFYCINNYIYNRAQEEEMPGLVMSLPDNVFFDISESNFENYTSVHGMITTILKNRSKVQGRHCRNCENSCKPMYIKGLDRLKLRT